MNSKMLEYVITREWHVTRAPLTHVKLPVFPQLVHQPIDVVAHLRRIFKLLLHQPQIHHIHHF